ncbi:DUF664 domain-containing protein [Mycolicibacterium fortuitum]|uniref:mycothiol transferase n=1 Tax=Mycolicibacterium fortuitum TaxID=1766 RepID=UPI003AF8C84F
MTSTEGPMPPMNADERTTLESWLEFYRATLALKCEGLNEEQLRSAPVPPSELTLLGLVQHAAEVERNWFRRVLTGEDAAPISDRATLTAMTGASRCRHTRRSATRYRSGRTRSNRPVSTVRRENSTTPRHSWAARSACVGSTST